MPGIQELLDALELEETAERRYSARNVEEGPGVIFGGQLLAQTIVAAARGQEGKTVKTVHTVFARAGSSEASVEIDVDPMHSGRAFASSTVTIRQGDRLVTRSLVLLSADEPDLIRHADAMPPHLPPEADPASPDLGAWKVVVVGGIDVNDPSAVGPPEVDVWTRFDGAPDDPLTSQALLAYATDGFLIGAAMRPHEGVGQSLAHVSISTGVITHTITFHEPFVASDWMLLAQRAPYAGRGRSYGRGDVFAADDVLVASFVQDSMIRHVPDNRSSEGRLL